MGREIVQLESVPLLQPIIMGAQAMVLVVRTDRAAMDKVVMAVDLGQEQHRRKFCL